MDYKTLMRQDYDKKIKFNGNNLFCYSKKKIKQVYSDCQKHVVGEMVKSEKGDQYTDKIQINSEWFHVTAKGARSRLLYWEAGYVCVNDNEYVIVLKNRLVYILPVLFLAILLTCVTCFSSMLNNTVPVIQPVPVDPNVGIIENDNSEKKESEDGGGSVTLTYSLNAKLTLSTGNIQMYFLNPNASNQDIVLSLYIVDDDSTVKIAESGCIQPGYGLTEMKLIDNAAILSEGSYEGLFIVSFYQPQTGEKALVESNITDVVIDVLP